jgi:hypothetical protein
MEELIEDVSHGIPLAIIIHNWDENFWERNNGLSELDKAAVRQIVREEFAPLIRETTDTLAYPIVRRAQLFIESMLLVGLDVPYPRRVARHVTAVVDNTMEVYFELMEQDLKTSLRPDAMRRLNFN